MGYWQVSAGYGGEKGGGRNYSDVFLDYGVMLIGPGEYDSYRTNVPRYEREKDGREVIRFAEEVNTGDVVVLKRPVRAHWEVLAVGVVKSDYEWMPMFDDVEGWDIRHGRRVKWVRPAEGEGQINGLTQGRFKRIDNKEAKQAIEHILEFGTQVRSGDLPSPVQGLDDEDLTNTLMNNGFKSEDATRCVQTFHRIEDLATWYRDRVRKGIKVREHETRTFLIVPLLQALGWPPEQLKIEWRNIDIAFFEKPYYEETDQCIMILESKRLLESLATKVEDQVTGYSSKCPNCEKLMVSDGCSYKLYEKSRSDNWEFSAYLNILKPRVSHPYRKNIGGASDVLSSLLSR